MCNSCTSCKPCDLFPCRREAAQGREWSNPVTYLERFARVGRILFRGLCTAETARHITRTPHKGPA
ncbi:hypothetical protein ACFPRL_05875 [Pseudoclavibacter helvolus]